MSFLNPQFLFGLLALSIPIIVHLFNFRKTKKIHFSSTQFLRHVKEASSSKLKLKHLLILTSRLLFIFFLVMAFAQPFIDPEEEGLQNNRVAIYLDNSLSMLNEVDDNVQGIDAAVDFVNSIVQLYPANTQYLLLTNDFAPFSNVYKNQEEILDITTEIKLSSIARDAEEIYKRIHGQNLLTGELNSDLFWISDFQKSTAKDLSILKSDTSNRIHLIPVLYSSTANIFIDSVYLDNPFIGANEGAVLTVLLKNKSEVAVSDLLLNVFVNNIQVASGSVNIPADASSETKFDIGFRLDEINKCRVSFEEYPVTFDNDFYFSINRAQRISITEIKNVEEVTPIEQVFGNQDIFKYSGFHISNLNYNAIQNADLVILNGLPQIDAALASSILELRNNFGNILLIPAPEADLLSYRQITGGRPLGWVDTTYLQPMAPPDLNNPFFDNVFENENQNISMPDASHMLTWGRDRDAILRFRNDAPFLSGFRGSGMVYLMSSPLTDEYTNLHRHGVFLPVMYKMAISSLREHADLYYSMDDPVVRLKIDSIEKDDVFKLIKDDKEIIPAQRFSGNEVFLEVPKYSLETGFYDLVFKDKLENVLSFNVNKSESLLEQYEVNELKQLFPAGNVSIFESENAAQLTSELKEKYLGVPLWKYAIILALIFLLAEILLIRYL